MKDLPIIKLKMMEKRKLKELIKGMKQLKSQLIDKGAIKEEGMICFVIDEMIKKAA